MHGPATGQQEDIFHPETGNKISDIVGDFHGMNLLAVSAMTIIPSSRLAASFGGRFE